MSSEEDNKPHKQAFPEEEIYRFWFGECVDKPDSLQPQGRVWFSQNEAQDLYLKKQFGYLFPLLAQHRASAFPSARAALSAILVLDQFSRQIFRSTPRAYAYDSYALAIMDAAMEKDWATHLTPIERAFLYMPLMNAEGLSLQKQSTRLFKELVMEAQEPYRSFIQGLETMAIRNRMLIERFGRFPQRNRILGRRSQDDEASWLLQANKRSVSVSRS